MKLHLFTCRSVYSGESPRAVLILEPRHIPTTSFYVRSRIPKGVASRRYDSVARPPHNLSMEEGTWVIIVRHASRRWLKSLLEERSKITKVTYLKDDDIASVFSARDLPWYYALWTGWRYLTIRGLLSKLVSEIVVSTQELAERYPASNPSVWEPHYDDTSEFHSETLVYFYHATITHLREMRWLVPIVRRVQQAVPNAWFEIIGDASVARMFRGIPRVRVIHPMNWPDYQAYIQSVRYDVGLAPLHDTAFNRARSHTKLYQITRASAAGIFSDVIPYSRKIVDGATGVLCKNHRYLWVKSIIALLNNSARRAVIRENARIWCQEHQEHYQEKAVEEQVSHG